MKAICVGTALQVIVFLNFVSPLAGAEWETLNEQALELRAKGKYAKGLDVADKAVKSARRAFGGDSPEYAISVNTLAMLHLSQKQYAQAERLFKDCLSVLENSLGRSHPERMNVLVNLAGSYVEQRRYDEAEPLYREAIDTCIRNKHPFAEQATLGLAWLRFVRGQYDEAIREYERAKGLRSARLGPDHSDVKAIEMSIAGVRDKAKNAEKMSGGIAAYKRLEREYMQYRDRGEFEKALDVAAKVQKLAENDLKSQPAYFGTALMMRAMANGALRRQGDALKLYEEAQPILEESLGPDHGYVLTCVDARLSYYIQHGREADAVSLCDRVVSLIEDAYGPDDQRLGSLLCRLAGLHIQQDRLAQAEEVYGRVVNLFDELSPEDPLIVASALRGLASVARRQWHFDDAEAHLRRASRLLAEAVPEPKWDIAANTESLGALFAEQGRYTEADDCYQQALAIIEEVNGPDDILMAPPLARLADTNILRGRYGKAESFCQQALAINLKVLGPKHANTAKCVGTLAQIYADQGLYADAESLYRRCLPVLQAELGPRHADVISAQVNLTLLYWAQGRHEKAEEMLGELRDVPDTFETHTGLIHAMSLVSSSQGRYAEGTKHAQQALTMCREALPREHPRVATNLQTLGMILQRQGRYVEAERFVREALEIQEGVFGRGNHMIAAELVNLSLVLTGLQRYDEAESLLDRAVRFVDESDSMSADVAAYVLKSRAHLYWKTGRQKKAVTDLRRGIQFIFQMRGQASGSEQERATTFSRSASAFETMLSWQTQLQNLPEAFAAIEGFRAQGLQDLMQSNGTDLLEGLPDETAASLRLAELDAQAEVASLQKQLEVLQIRADMDSEDKVREGKRLIEALGEARQGLVQAWADIKNASPAYRMVVTEDREPVRFEAFQQELGNSDTVALQYLLGGENGFLLAYGGGIEPALITLEITDTQSEVYGCDAGPLTAARFRQVLLGSKDRPGLLRDLTNFGEVSDEGVPSKDALDALRTMWAVLVPDETLREKLVDGKSLKRLLILPDGVLARLPFEALVVNDDPQAPEYLLDNGPPTMYAPSATVFHNLKHREVSDSKGETLTVGDPSYGSTDESGDRGTVLEELQIASRFAHLGRLADLPWTGDESCWIKESCEDKHLPVVQLTKEKATEENVRNNVRGRSLVHFACHGLADNEYGNLFGALALAPVDAGDPSNDGFLTVAEMFDLDLHACELAILSACDTNIGPNQRGEGTWSMCRGMLTSGARRVVTTDWQVADEASAHLVYAFVYYLHDSESDGRDYAECLRNARLSIRNHDTRQWRHPYFWAPFVLMGPE